MEKRKWRLVHLHHIEAINRPLLNKILERDPSLELVYEWDESYWKDTFQLDKKRINKIFTQLHSNEMKRKVVKHVREFAVITILDDNFPKSLKSIPDPPHVLYLTGNIELLTHTPNLSVVGTRYPSKSAFPIMRKILTPLMEYKFLITSGMAMGVDGYAHQLALEHDAPTIAVLGGGFYHIYPKQHDSLFQQLIQKNLVISEYPPDQPPKRYHFPERNRIISGLSFGTFVIEAKQKSGTLITVDQALEQGKEVFALPGSILTETSSGCNQLIQDGAKLVQSHHDILEELPTISIK